MRKVETHDVEGNVGVYSLCFQKCVFSNNVDDIILSRNRPDAGRQIYTHSFMCKTTLIHLD